MAPVAKRTMRGGWEQGEGDSSSETEHAVTELETWHGKRAQLSGGQSVLVSRVFCEGHEVLTGLPAQVISGPHFALLPNDCLLSEV